MEREGREGKEMRKGRRGGVIVGGITLMLLFGCNNGVAELEKKNQFFDAVVKIGHGFQEIFGVFGNAMGEALGFNAVKSSDTRDKVGDHFEKIKKGIEETKTKLGELSGKISEAKNSDGSTIDTVKGAIKGANDIFDKLMNFLTKLANVAKGASGTEIGHNSTSAAVAANKQDVQAVIDSVNAIIEAATKSDVKIEQGTPGRTVNAGASDANNAVAAIAQTGAGASANAKLADEVLKSDPWAIIDKIKNSKTVDSTIKQSTENEAGVLAIGTVANSSMSRTGAKSTADVVAAVALKAMTKGGQFNASTNGEEIKAAVASAVNKVLGVLDEIIRRTVEKNLEKVREAVKGINYSDTNAEATEVKK